jgi:hypothetical protein
VSTVERSSVTSMASGCQVSRPSSLIHRARGRERVAIRIGSLPAQRKALGAGWCGKAAIDQPPSGCERGKRCGHTHRKQGSSPSPTGREAFCLAADPHARRHRAALTGDASRLQSAGGCSWCVSMDTLSQAGGQARLPGVRQKGFHPGTRWRCGGATIEARRRPCRQPRCRRRPDRRCGSHPESPTPHPPGRG